MPKCYILVRKLNEDYSSIPQDYEKVFIFDRVDSKDANLNAIWNGLADHLFTADPKVDRVVMNGPAFVIAMAGYMWYSEQRRLHHNMLAYCKDKSSYVEHATEIDQ